MRKGSAALFEFVNKGQIDGCTNPPRHQPENELLPRLLLRELLLCSYWSFQKGALGLRPRNHSRRISQSESRG